MWEAVAAIRRDSRHACRGAPSESADALRTETPISFPLRPSASFASSALKLFLTALALALALAQPALALTTPEDATLDRDFRTDLDVPYVPTKQETVEAMLALAGVGPKDVVYDLGCGDGRIVVTAAQRFGARGVGVDIDPARIAEARENARKAGVASRTTFHLGDLFYADIRDATVVMLYLLPSVNQKLKPRLLADLAPGTRVVSHDFDMGADWPPQKTVNLGRDTLYLWTVPARRAGK
jgi:SAM-dependent methyltransferase